MPWGDGTGPMGLGPRTGRGLGFCAGFNRPGYSWRGGFGRGLGWRSGFCRGFGWRWFWQGQMPAQPLSEEQQKQYLKARLSALEQEANLIREQLNEQQP